MSKRGGDAYPAVGAAALVRVALARHDDGCLLKLLVGELVVERWRELLDGKCERVAEGGRS